MARSGAGSKIKVAGQVRPATWLPTAGTMLWGKNQKMDSGVGWCGGVLVF